MKNFSFGLAIGFCLLACAGCAPHRSKKTTAEKTPQRKEKISAEKRSDRRLNAARRLLDAGRLDDARVKLQELVDDAKSPARNRARALWLILKIDGASDARAYWDLLERFPATVAAEDALREAIRLERRPPGVLVRRMLAFYRRHPNALSADLALMESARLALNVKTPAWRNYAVHLLTFLARNHPDSPHRDAALFRAAEILHEDGKQADAIRILQDLLQSEETSFFFGDYNSEWLDDALLLLGDLYLAQGNHKKAIQAWSELPRRFPHSRLRDRAWMRLMHQYKKIGNLTQACLAARTLIGRMPQSRFAPEVAVFLARCRRFP